MFQPPPPGQGMAAPQAPGTFQPPPPGQGGPPPPQAQGMFQPPPPPGGAAPAAPQPAANMYQQPPGAPGQMQAPGMSAPGAPGQPAQMFKENIDLSIQIPPRLFQVACSKIPQTAAIASGTKIPMGGVLRPLAPIPDDEEQIATVQPGSAGIIRCKRCRTYINAFVHWLEHGRRWRCNICAQVNETPAAYFCHLDDQGLRRDRNERPELSKGVVEFIAPAEYMVRPPQAPSYFFVIDVSAMAVRSGMLTHAANAIKQSLDDLPGRGRTKIGFITFDNSVHYYNLGSDLAQPQMLVVSDLKELFVPLPDNLLVNLQESRSVVDAFLDNLPEMFSKNPVVSQSCLGPALKAAFTVMKQIGGKMCVFQTIQPNLGDGALKPRENPGLMGTPNEVRLLRPDLPWYKDTAIEFSRQQISVDMFLFPYQYMDLAALGELPKYTAGSLHSYVSFNPEKDGQRFEQRLIKTLTEPTAFEAVMRIRCTKGMRITNFYGNFYIRGTDLMALPNVNMDSIFGFDLAHDEQNVVSNYVTIQAALLYTSSEGQRRIRVMTQALPVTNLTTELVASVDPLATCNLISKQAVDVSIKTTIDNARMRMQQTCCDIIRASKGGDKRTVSGYSVPSAPSQNNDEDKPLPENLELIPLYTLALMKNVAFRGGTDVHPDERVQAHHLLNHMWIPTSKRFIYPKLFALHNMNPNAGYPAEKNGDDEDDDKIAGRNRIQLPDVVSLTVDNLSSNGIYLLDNGVDMFVWVGRSANQMEVNALFGTPSLESVDPNQIKLQTTGDDLATRVGSVVDALRDDSADPYIVSSRIQVVREGDAHMESRFFWFFVEDAASFQGGTYNYEEFMKFVKNPSTGPQVGGPPGMAPRGGPPGQPRGPPMPNQGMAPPQAPGNRGPPMPNQGMPPPAMPQQSQPGPPQMPPASSMPPPQAHSAPPSYSQGPPSGPPAGPPAGPPSYSQAPPAGPPSGPSSYSQGPPPGPPAGPPSYSQAPPAGPPSGPPSYSQGPPSGPPAGPPSNSQAPPAGPPSGPPSYSQGPPSGPPQAPPPARSMPPPPARNMPPPPPGPPRGGPPPPPPPPPGR